MYGSSGAQFFKTITGIQSGPDASQESRSVTIFQTIFGFTEISFRDILLGIVEISSTNKSSMDSTSNPTLVHPWNLKIAIYLVFSIGRKGKGILSQHMPLWLNICNKTALQISYKIDQYQPWTLQKEASKNKKEASKNKSKTKEN